MKNSIRNVGVITALLLVSMSVQAGLLTNSISGTTVTYSNVSEDIQAQSFATGGLYEPSTGTYGTPTVSGNLMDFNPSNLVASAVNGEYMIKDAELSFEAKAAEGFHIPDLVFSEAGDSILNEINATASAFTSTKIEFTYFIDIIEVDGVPFTGSLTNYSGSASFASFEAPGDLGVSNWFGGITIDIEKILIDSGVDYRFGATEIGVVIDNLMFANSQVGTGATIKKKDADGFAVTAVSIPEPASAVLMVGMTSGLMFVRRRFIS